MRYLYLAVLLLGAPLAAGAADVRVERIDVLDAGVYAVETGEETADQNAPTGTIADVTTATLLEATTAVPGRLGLEFGLRYEIIGTPPGAEVPLDFVIVYPPPGLVDPTDPVPLTESRFTQPERLGAPSYVGYGFENDWEIVPGDWTFEIWFEGRNLTRQSFTVSK